MKYLSSKYSQKLIDYTKQSTTDAFKTALKWGSQKTAEWTSDLRGNKIANNIKKISKTSSQNSSNASENEAKCTGFNKKYLKKERYWWSEINIINIRNGISKNNNFFR